MLSRIAVGFFLLTALLFPSLVSVASATRLPSPDTPLPVVNGDFENGFEPVVVGGVDGEVGAGWTPFVQSGAPRFLAGHVQPPPNSWQVIDGAAGGAYVAGIYQRVGEVRAGDRLRASVQVYLPASVDGITKTIGIDPNGGEDPASPAVAWSSGGSGGPWQTLAVTATAAATQTTVFVRIERPEQGLAGYALIDNVSLERVGFASKAYMPLVTVGTLPAEPAWRYQVSNIITGTASCNNTGLGGVIRNEAGAPQAGVRVAVWEAPPGQRRFLSAPSGQDGRWQVTVDAHAASAGRWLLAVVDPAGRTISPEVGKVAYKDDASNPESPGIPTSADCVNGHQQLTVNFRGRQDFPQYTLVSTRFLSCQDNHLDHNLRLWVIDQDGIGQRGLLARFAEAGGFTDDILTGRDPYKPPGYIDYPVYRRQTWTARVLAGTSDVSLAMSTETAPSIDACTGNAWGHYSYEVVFQRKP